MSEDNIVSNDNMWDLQLEALLQKQKIEEDRQFRAWWFLMMRNCKKRYLNGNSLQNQ